MAYVPSYPTNPADDNAMTGVVIHGSIPNQHMTYEPSLTFRLRLTPEVMNQAKQIIAASAIQQPPSDINNEYDTRHNRSRMLQQGKVTGVGDAAYASPPGIPPSGVSTYGTPKKNTAVVGQRSTASKSGATGVPVGTPQHPIAHHNQMRRSGTPGSNGAPVTPQVSNRTSVGSPFGAPPHPMTPGSNHMPGNVYPSSGTPSHQFQHPKQTMTPSTPNNFEVENIAAGTEDVNSAFGSDEEGDDDKKNKNKKNKPKGNTRATAAATGTTSNRTQQKADDESLYGDEDAHSAGYTAASAIWKMVEAYFADFTEEDIKFCTPDTKDEAFKIPPLGKRPVSLLQASSSDMIDISGSQNVASNSGWGGPNGPTFVSRLLSSLVEESSISQLNPWLSARPPFVEMPMPQSEMDHTIGTYTAQENEFLEERLKKDMTVLGLFGELEPPPSPFTSTTRTGKETRASAAAAAAMEVTEEDDEVLIRLKRYQAELRAQLEINNATKAILRKQIEESNGERKKAKEHRDSLNKTESHYVQLHRGIKKRKKTAGKQTKADGGSKNTTKGTDKG